MRFHTKNIPNFDSNECMVLSKNNVITIQPIMMFHLHPEEGVPSQSTSQRHVASIQLYCHNAARCVFSNGLALLLPLLPQRSPSADIFIVFPDGPSNTLVHDFVVRPTMSLRDFNKQRSRVTFSLTTLTEDANNPLAALSPRWFRSLSCGYSRLMLRSPRSNGLQPKVHCIHAWLIICMIFPIFHR